MLSNLAIKVRSKVEKVAAQRGYGLGNIYSSQLAGKGKLTAPLRTTAYGTFGAMIVSKLAFGPTGWALGLGEKAMRMYGSPYTSSGQFGNRNTYRPVNAGLSGMKFSFRGRVR